MLPLGHSPPPAPWLSEGVSNGVPHVSRQPCCWGSAPCPVQRVGSPAPRTSGAVATCPAALPLAFLPASPGPSCRAGTLHAQAKPGQAQHSPTSPRRHFWGAPGQALPPESSCEQAGSGHGSAWQRCGASGRGCSASCWEMQYQMLGGTVPAATGLCRAIGCSGGWGGGLWGAVPARHSIMGHNLTCSWGSSL